MVRFDPKQVVPSQPIYTQRNDQLVFFAQSNTANLIFRVNYRWLTPEGEIREGEADSAPFTGSAAVIVTLYEGWLLSFGVRVTSGNVPGQWCYVLCELARGNYPSVTAPIVGILWQGYVTFNVSNGWPGMPSKDIGDGSGTLRLIVGTTPAAGAEILETVPNRCRWTLIALRAQLTSSATVANRSPAFVIDDGANTFYGVHSSFAQTAGSTDVYQTAAGNPFFNDGSNTILIPFPSFLQMKTGYRFRSVTVGLQAADQWNAPVYLVQEWGVWDL